MVELVDDAAHADVGTILQRPGQHQRAVATSRPVVVLHVASVHVPHAASRLDHVGCIDVAVVEGRHDGGRLEYRSRLQQVAHRMVGDLPVLSVVAVLHVDHGLDVSRGHLHDDRHADLSADQFQLVHDGPLRQVLHVDVDRGHYVRSVSGGTSVMVRNLLRTIMLWPMPSLPRSTESKAISSPHRGTRPPYCSL